MSVVGPPKGPGYSSGGGGHTRSSTPAAAHQQVSARTVVTTVVFLGAFIYLGAFPSAFFGALAGIVSAWLQRGFRIRNKFGLSLVESLITSHFWTEVPKTAAAQVLLGALAGVVAAGIAGWVSLPVDAHHISTVLAAAIGSGGPPPTGGAFIGFFLLIVVVCVIVYLILNPLIAHKILHEMLGGSVESVSGKIAASLFLHEYSEPQAAAIAKRPDLHVKMLWPSAVEGAITGALVSLVLIACGLGGATH